MRFEENKNFNLIQLLGIFLLMLASNACIDPIDVKTLTFEDVLVVDARITNEYKTHQIKLSNSYTFEEESPNPETNAQVVIIDDLGGSITFIEDNSNPGTYYSAIEFAAEAGKIYQLQITTASGEQYESTPTPLTAITKIDALYAEKGVDNFNNGGISIFLDSYDPSRNSNYYRYEFEETYKIIAPYWVPDDIYVENYPPYAFSIGPKTTEQRICYNTLYSNDIILAQTTDLEEDRIERFQVQFISNRNPIMAQRYSILVKQYVQSIEAHTYYKTLKKFSSSDDPFSQNQPGFIQGNISSLSHVDEKVIGIFEVSSVDEQRIFFDYVDFYPQLSKPPYYVDCDQSAPSARVYPGDNYPPPLQDYILRGVVKYLDLNPKFPDPEDENAGPYLVVPAACGDCTVLGTNVKPDFWQ